MLCVRVKISKRSFEPFFSFCVWILFCSFCSSSHSVSDFFLLHMFYIRNVIRVIILDVTKRHGRARDKVRGDTKTCG